VIHREVFTVETDRGRGTYELTPQLHEAVDGADIRDGLCSIFVHHTSASLLVNENADPQVRRDLDAFFARMVPDGDAIFGHTAEGPDDMSAHVRSALTLTSLNIPVAGGRLDLGTWQGVYLWEHRTQPHRRKLTVTVLGE
jgi:secondary thiamine-phosphate synthase enzyme